MSKKLIISGTNRPNSNSLKVSEAYYESLVNMGEDCELLNLEDLPHSFVFSDAFGERSEEMETIIQECIIPADHFIFVIAEYNGGFPGILKAFIDCLPPSILHHKKASLVGLSSGHAGGLRALDQMTNVLHYLKVNVHYAKPKYSGIDAMISQEGELNDLIRSKIDEHAKELVLF
jgi:NAD(P)H-dependent FMN reductase